MNRPDYRFRGSIAPKPGIRASILTPENTDGVATLRLYDPIDSWGGEWGVSAKEFARALGELPDGTAEIRLHLNSPGGEVWEGVAMANMLREHPAKVVAVVDGIAASAASFIAAAADETIMGRNSQMMIHDAWGLVVGNAADMTQMAGVLDKLSQNIASIYAAKSGQSDDFWREAMRAESWYNADEAVEAGLADSVAQATEKQPAARQEFDLSVFNHAGRDQAPPPAIPEVAPPAPDPEQVAAHNARLRAELERLATA